MPAGTRLIFTNSRRTPGGTARGTASDKFFSFSHNDPYVAKSWDIVKLRWRHVDRKFC